MKAIIKVNEGSSYAKYNGLTFDVAEIKSSFVCLDINGVRTDFSHKEVVICELQNEIQKAFDDYNYGSDNKTHIVLGFYCSSNKINFQPKYNCPA